MVSCFYGKNKRKLIGVTIQRPSAKSQKAVWIHWWMDGILEKKESPGSDERGTTRLYHVFMRAGHNEEEPRPIHQKSWDPASVPELRLGPGHHGCQWPPEVPAQGADGAHGKRGDSGGFDWQIWDRGDRWVKGESADSLPMGKNKKKKKSPPTPPSHQTVCLQILSRQANLSTTGAKVWALASRPDDSYLLQSRGKVWNENESHHQIIVLSWSWSF